MKKLSDEKMQQLREAISKADQEQKLLETQELQNYETRMAKVLAFKAPNAGEKLIQWIKDGELITPELEVKIVRALIKGKLSEADFLTALELYGSQLDDKAVKLIIKSVCEKKISEKTFLSLIKMTYVLWVMVPPTFVEAIAAGKLSEKFLISMVKYRYDFHHVCDLLAYRYVKGKISEETISKMILAKFAFTKHAEWIIVHAAAKCKCSEDKLKTLLEANHCFFNENIVEIVQGVLWGNISESLLLEMTKKILFSDEAVLLILQAVQDGKLSEDVLYNVIADRDNLSCETWQVLFDSGIDFAVVQYVHLFYPNLEAELEF